MQSSSTQPSQQAEVKNLPDLSTTSVTSFTLEALKLIKESQQQHGLRHGDYQRYRSYCSRRLRRIRKTLHFVCGNMRRYQKRELTVDDLIDSKYLLLPLFQAERAWAYGMQLKQESNNDPRKKFHLINRLKKAVKFSIELEKLSQSSKCDARTKLEAQGYNSLMNGQYYFEKQNWIESLKYFNISKKIYENLSIAINGDDSQVFYTQKVEEIIPNIRYCNYNLGDETAKKDLVDMKMKSIIGSEIAENIDVLISQTREKQVTTFSEVNWRNKIKLQIKNEKAKLFLLNVQDYEKQIQTAPSFEVKISIYENILKESVDVIQIIRDELKLDQHFQVIQRGQPLPPDEKPSNTLLLFSYLTWTRTNKTIERNLLMLDSYRQGLNSKQSTNNQTQNEASTEEMKAKNAKPQDIVRLYDIVIQNLKDLVNLPGLSNDKQYVLDSEFLISFYKTFRAYYISLFYLANKKYKEAVAFFFRVEKYIKMIEVGLKNLDKSSDLFKSKNEYESQMKVLINELNQSKYKIQTAALLEDGSNENELKSKDSDSNKEKLEKTPLTERLDIYFEDSNISNKNPNIIKLPIDFEPIPCKPLFFDLALNHLELPSYQDKIDTKKQAEQQQTGVKGFIKGMFGFR